MSNLKGALECQWLCSAQLWCGSVHSLSELLALWPPMRKRLGKCVQTSITQPGIVKFGAHVQYRSSEATDCLKSTSSEIQDGGGHINLEF